MAFNGKSHRRKFCGKIVFVAFAIVFLTSVQTNAAQVEINSETIFRFFERDVLGSKDKTVVPAYEYFQLDADKLSNENFSVHLYGWGRLDIADSGYFRDDPVGALLYGYLEYRNNDYNLRAKLGRQSIFEGVANETLDGIWVVSDFTPSFSMSIYGGRPVSLDTGIAFHGDSIVGARASLHQLLLYDVGLSAKQITNDEGGDEAILGLDFSFFLPGDLILSGLSAYNLETSGMSESLVEARFGVNNIDFRPYIQLVQYEDYFASEAKNVNLFNALSFTNEESRFLGVDATWHQSKKFDVGCKIKNIDYDIKSGTAFYYSGLLSFHVTETFEAGGELGYMDGDTAEDRYLLGRMYLYLDQLATNNMIKIVSCDLQYVSYDQPIYGEDNSYSMSIGAGNKYLNDSLEVKISGDYNKGPYFDNDIKLLLSVKYIFKQ